MHSQVRLGRLLGIRIGLHYSWFIIALLIVVSLFSDFHLNHSQWSVPFVLLLSVTTAFLFFVSLLLHELSHSLVARTHGLPVREITLFALGGVSQIDGEAPSARAEFWIAIVGPLCSLLIGAACLSAVGAIGAIGNRASLSPLMAMLSWLGYINLGLACFNMLPGYPMDGGRVLRAILWWKTRDLDRATRGAAVTGQIVASLFIALGIIQYFRGAGLGSLWIVFIGWFLLQAARESYFETTLKGSLNGVRVTDLMARDFPTVDGNLSVEQFVAEVLLRTGRRCFLVLRDGRVTGLVTPHEIKHLDRAQWPKLTLNAVMRPLEQVRTVSPDTSLLQALQVMGQEDLNQLPVLSDGHPEGVLSREKILEYLRTRMDLQSIRG